VPPCARVPADAAGGLGTLAGSVTRKHVRAGKSHTTSWPGHQCPGRLNTSQEFRHCSGIIYRAFNARLTTANAASSVGYVNEEILPGDVVAGDIIALPGVDRDLLVRTVRLGQVASFSRCQRPVIRHLIPSTRSR
jgi:hypothetical protein